MKTTKPRNREHRTKSAQQGNLITIVPISGLVF